MFSTLGQNEDQLIELLIVPYLDLNNINRFVISFKNCQCSIAHCSEIKNQHQILIWLQENLFFLNRYGKYIQYKFILSYIMCIIMCEMTWCKRCVEIVNFHLYLTFLEIFYKICSIFFKCFGVTDVYRIKRILKYFITDVKNMCYKNIILPDIDNVRTKETFEESIIMFP